MRRLAQAVEQDGGAAGEHGGAGQGGALAQVGDRVGGQQGAGGVEQDGVGTRTGLAGQGGLQERGAGGGVVAAGELRGGAAREAGVLGRDDVSRSLAIAELGDLRGSGEGQLVLAVVAVDHQGAGRAQLGQGAGEQVAELRRVDAQQLVADTGGVGQWPQQVEHRAHAQRLAHGHGVAHGRVMTRGEEEGQAHLVQQTAEGARVQIQVHPQGLQDVGRAAGRAGRTVAMLGHRHAGGGGDQGGAGGDVEGAAAVAAGAAGVDGLAGPGGDHRHHPGPHGAGEAAQLGRGGALQAQGGQHGAQTRGIEPAVHDVVHEELGLRGGEVTAGEQVGEDRGQGAHGVTSGAGTHSRSQFCSSRAPSAVMMDSGWNCTPKLGRVRWRTPMTSPASV